jgi:phosphopantothenoylcysteine decarboxylase/phosphopantothenate--cysteine ligase
VKKPSRILITAGPTIEPIDPVRFMSNRSTGYMGYELARAAKKRGYRVTLISGPSRFEPPRGIKFLSAETARELRDKVWRELKKSDIFVMASAVSDYRPISFSRNKIKSEKITLKLVKNPDILKSITQKMRKNKIIVGFSLETKDLLKNSLRKLKEKKLDLIVANECGRENVPFGKGRSTVYLLDKHKRCKTLKKAGKPRIACAILDTIKELCYTPN